MRRAAFRIFPRQTLSVRARPPHTGAPHPQPAAMRRRISFGESVAICRGLLYTGWCCGAAGRARGAKAHTERYRSGHNGGASKALWEQSHVGSNPTLSAKAEGPCSAWALCFAFGQVGFEGRNRKCRSAAFSRPGERWPAAVQPGRQTARGQRGESHPLRQSRGPMQRMGPLLCFWTGGIRRAEQAWLRWSLAPPRGERARDCAARSASRPPPVRRIPPSCGNRRGGPMQRMGPLLCLWTGGIRRAEQ